MFLLLLVYHSLRFDEFLSAIFFVFLILGKSQPDVCYESFFYKNNLNVRINFGFGPPKEILKRA